MVRVDLRTVTLNIPPQEVITRDNVPASVNAVCYFRVVNASDAIVQVENYLLATSQIAQTTLRAVLGRAELDTLLSERDRLNDELQRIIDEQTEPWGIKVTTVEIKDVEIPQTMQRAMARQAEAERERRAKIIAAEGEFQASDKLAQAAATIGKHPVAIQLRFLQTLLEIGSEHNSTTIFPLPIDLFTPFLEAATSEREDDAAARLSGASRASDRPAHGSEGRAGAGPGGPAVQLRVVRRRTTGAREQCPLCEGHESWTPPETYALRPGGGAARLAGLARARGAEQVPAAGAGRAGGAPRIRSRADAATRSCFVTGTATGQHEVIVHAPEHVASMTELDAEQFRSAPSTGWRARSAAHADAAYVHLMVNEGHAAGASLEHTHAQLYALDFVPALIAREREHFTAHNTRTMGGCLLCDLLQEEVRRRERVIAVDDHAVLLAPFASRVPYELQLVPRRHEPSFAEAEPARRPAARGPAEAERASARRRR